jgi:hypothetical protein
VGARYVAMMIDEECGIGASLAGRAAGTQPAGLLVVARGDNEGMPYGQSSPLGPFGGWGRRDVRASDADRERVVDTLREHAGDGRLSVEELTERIDHAYSAKTVGELDVVLHDLPPTTRDAGVSNRTPVPAVMQGFVRPRRRRRSLGFFAVRLAIIDIACLVIWAVTGHHTLGGFWPIWPIILTVVWFAFRGVRALERRRSPAATAVLGAPAVARAARQVFRESRRGDRR